MTVDSHEISFIKNNAPYGMLKTLSRNIGMDYQKVRTMFISIREDYPDDMIIEARRLLKANTGLEFKPQVLTETE